MITYEENLIEKSIPEMKRSEKNLYIWGAKELGVKIGRFLKRRGIDFNGYLVEKRYAKDHPMEIMGHPVYILEDHMQDNVGELIVAFAGYSGNLPGGGIKDNIEKIYVFDFIGALVLEEENILSLEMYKENKEKIKWLEDNLADEKSVKVYKDYLSQKMTSVYAGSYDTIEQYFDPSVYTLQDEEVFIDCGAFQGETSESFIKQMEQNGKQYKKIYMIEADKVNAGVVRECFADKPGIKIIEAGVWDNDGKICFSQGNGTNSAISDDGGTVIDTVTIDRIVKDEHVTFIKMDIEGAELRALRGAKDVIERCRPKLAICVYHRPEDLFMIPQYIRSLYPGYKLYLRKYQPYGIETVLYAV